MKKFGALLIALFLVTGVMAQNEGDGKQSLFSTMFQKNILNHLDVGVNVGTVGIGIDIAMPVGEYVRVRAGYNYMPSFKFNSDFDIETRSGGINDIINKVGRLDDKLTEFGIDINSPGFENYKEKLDKFRKVEIRDYVTVGMKPNIHQFKFLVDVLPFKDNKHWSFTAGFFVGPSSIANACNADKETLILEGINAYNELYLDYPNHGIKGAYLHYDGRAEKDPFYRYGVAGFNIGTFDDGDMAMMVPGKDNTVRAEMKVSPFRPYLGFGYNTHLSKDRKWNMNVDAGILFLFGAPAVYVDNVYKINTSSIQFDESGRYVSGIGFDADDNYYGDIIRWNEDEYEYEPCSELLNDVNLMRDVHDIPGKVGNMTNTISKFKVYPNASVTFSYRLF